MRRAYCLFLCAGRRLGVRLLSRAIAAGPYSPCRSAGEVITVRMCGVGVSCWPRCLRAGQFGAGGLILSRLRDWTHILNP